MLNEEWKKGYRDGFSDGYAQAKKEMTGLPINPNHLKPYCSTTGGTGLYTVGATGSTYSVSPTSPFTTETALLSDDC